MSRRKRDWADFWDMTALVVLFIVFVVLPVTMIILGSTVWKDDPSQECRDRGGQVVENSFEQFEYCILP